MHHKNKIQYTGRQVRDKWKTSGNKWETSMEAWDPQHLQRSGRSERQVEKQVGRQLGKQVGRQVGSKNRNMQPRVPRI